MKSKTHPKSWEDAAAMHEPDPDEEPSFAAMFERVGVLEAKLDSLKVGDRVCYKGVQGLLGDTGTIIATGPTKRGGDCLVRWDRHLNVSAEECLSNLQRRK